MSADDRPAGLKRTTVYYMKTKKYAAHPVELSSFVLFISPKRDALLVLLENTSWQ